jgi:hypothetical protein
MPAKRNPLNLNPLQLKTLTLLQELARVAGKPAAEVDPEGGEPDGVAITELPNPHGDHFHLGEAAVAARDATGLRNPSVWAALERKGLIRPNLPEAVILTALGQEYDTGLRDTILHRASH